MFFGEPPDPARVEAWNRTFREHARNPDDPTRCAIPDCRGRFPCAFRVEAAELLIVAGIGLPAGQSWTFPNQRGPVPRAPIGPTLITP